MLYPSIDSLLEVIDSKYTLVTLSAKRARDIQDHQNQVMEEPQSFTPVGIALEEIQEGKLTYEQGESKDK